MKSAICNLNLRDLVIWPLLAAADKLIVAISRVKSGLKGPGVVALGSVNEALQAAGEGLAWEGPWKSEFWSINEGQAVGLVSKAEGSGFRLQRFRLQALQGSDSVTVQGSGLGFKVRALKN